MFDRNKEFIVRILSGEEKRCTVRFPTDAEWAERTRKRRVIRRNIGRGQTEVEVPDPTGPDSDLFAKICSNGDAEHFNEAERAKVIRRLERCEVIAAEREGDSFRIKIAIPGGIALHVLRIPMQADVLRYGNTSVKTIDNRRTQDLKLSLEPSAELWQKVIIEAEGYASQADVPIVHKDVVVLELLNQVELAEQADDYDPEV